MFIYLNKKIQIPYGSLHCVSWNRSEDDGCIAFGGDNAMLKVIKLDQRGIKNGINQTLEGHRDAVVVVTWNEQHRKLTTSDEHGLIIVWMWHKGQWIEEMINNRNKSVVTDMKWTPDGQKICIVYLDGAVIVGSVDGNRLWGRDMGADLNYVEWTPDGCQILFGTSTGEVRLYDAQGEFIRNLEVSCVGSNRPKLAGLDWFPRHLDRRIPCLAVCYQSGHAQIMVNDRDETPVLINTKLISATEICWNPDGTVLAIAGTGTAMAPDGSSKSTPVVQFYSPWGRHLRTLKVPGLASNLSHGKAAG
jgi:WD repeat-containing protein 35